MLRKNNADGVEDHYGESPFCLYPSRFALSKDCQNFLLIGVLSFLLLLKLFEVSFQSLNDSQVCHLHNFWLQVTPSRNNPSVFSHSWTFLFQTPFPFHTNTPLRLLVQVIIEAIGTSYAEVPSRASYRWLIGHYLNIFQKSKSIFLLNMQILSNLLNHIVKIQQRASLVVTQVPKGHLGVGSDVSPEPLSAGGHGVAHTSTDPFSVGWYQGLAEQSWRWPTLAMHWALLSNPMQSQHPGCRWKRESWGVSCETSRVSLISSSW